MAWLTTKDGRHFNTDWIDKERQIAENKKQADERNGKKSEKTGAEWLDFGASYSEDFNPNINEKERAREWIQKLKDTGIVNKGADITKVHDYFIHYGEYDISEYKNAPYGKLAEGFARYVEGATKKGYDNNKKGLDAEYGLSKFIDSHSSMQLDTDTPMYRGVRTSQKDIELLQLAYKGKSPISMRGISSWTASDMMADRFTLGTLDKSGDIRLVYKDVTKGVRAAMPWPHSGQKEAIYSSSARFEIVGMKKTKTGYEVEVRKKG